MKKVFLMLGSLAAGFFIGQISPSLFSSERPPLPLSSKLSSEGRAGLALLSDKIDRKLSHQAATIISLEIQALQALSEKEPKTEKAERLFAQAWEKRMEFQAASDEILIGVLETMPFADRRAYLKHYVLSKSKQQEALLFQPFLLIQPQAESASSDGIAPARPRDKVFRKIQEIKQP